MRFRSITDPPAGPPQSRIDLSPAQGVVVLALLLAGALMRFHALERQSLWDDEMSTLRTLSTPLKDWPAHFRVYEMHPPLFFLQLRAWESVTGSSLAALRANSAFWGVAGLALIFLLARRYLGVAGGLMAMALMACSPYHLAYSQELRPYALGIVEGILGLWTLEKCLEAPPPPPSPSRGEGVRVGVWTSLGIIWTALLYTHYWGSFVALAQMVYGWFSAPSQEQRKRVILTGAVSSALFCLWLPILGSQMHYISGLSFWVPPPAPVNLAKTFVAFTGLFFRHASLAFRAPGPLLLNGGVGLIYLGMLGMGISRGPRAAGIWLLVGITLPFLLSYLEPGLYVGYRYPSLMYPAFALLVASGIQAVPNRILRTLALGLLLVTGLWGCWAYATTWQKANPKTVMAYVQTLKQPDTVVIRPFYFSDLFNYYDQGPTVVIDEDKLVTREERSALKGKKLLFIAFDVPADPVRDALLREFTVVSSRTFPAYARLGVTVYALR